MSPNWAKTQEEENGVHVACQRGRALVYPVTSSFGACMQLGPSVTAIDLPACLLARHIGVDRMDVRSRIESFEGLDGWIDGLLRQDRHIYVRIMKGHGRVPNAVRK